MLWGEAVRHATYLLNRVATRSLLGKTPYEALRHKKPNIAHLKVFGCVCYARTETAARKKLDDRSRILVHLGTEPGSKAYKLFDPSNRKIVVSHDVYFEEEKQRSWNNETATKPVQSLFEIDLIPLKGIDDYSGAQDGSENEDDEVEEEDGDDEYARILGLAIRVLSIKLRDAQTSQIVCLLMISTRIYLYPYKNK